MLKGVFSLLENLNACLAAFEKFLFHIGFLFSDQRNEIWKME